MYTPFRNPGADNLFAQHYTNVVPEHDLIFDGFYDKDPQTGELIPHGTGHMTHHQHSPSTIPSGRGIIQSEGGLKPYEWTEKDTMADHVVDLTIPNHHDVAMLSSQVPDTFHPGHSVSTHSSPYQPSERSPRVSPEYNVDDTSTSPIDQNGSILNSIGMSWWKIALIVIFLFMASFFWLKIIETIISLTISGRMSNLIINIILAIVFTFIGLLILWLNM